MYCPCDVSDCEKYCVEGCQCKMDSMRPRDLGHDHEWIPYTDDDEIGGIFYRHNRPDGSPCNERRWSPIPFDRWELVSRDPLHIEPSLLCQLCGDHGFIRDGAWVPV